MNANEYRKRQEKVRERLQGQVPEIGLVLGTGLGSIAASVENPIVIPFSDIPYRPKATNEGHKGELICGTYKGAKILVSNGRLHFYEGYSSEEIVRPIRLRKRLGVKRLILTNAAGSANKERKPGTLRLIKDQISRRVPSPLIGENIALFGPRFPDRSDVYDTKERERILKEASLFGLDVKEGVYRQFTGPQYETASEVSLAHKLGADAVGRSTAVEAIAASHRGLKTIGISLLTNYGTGIAMHKLSDMEVKERGKKNGPRFSKLVDLSIEVLRKGIQDDR